MSLSMLRALQWYVKKSGKPGLYSYSVDARVERALARRGLIAPMNAGGVACFVVTAKGIEAAARAIKAITP